MTERWKVRRRRPDGGPEVDKRLSGPELAAEFWRTRVEELELMRDEYSPAPAQSEGEVIARFATLPHYDEEPA